MIQHRLLKDYELAVLIDETYSISKDEAITVYNRLRGFGPPRAKKMMK